MVTRHVLTWPFDGNISAMNDGLYDVYERLERLSERPLLPTPAEVESIGTELKRLASLAEKEA